MKPIEHGTRPLIRKGRRLGRIGGRKFWAWVFLFAAIFFIYLFLFGLKMHSPANLESSNTSISILAKQEVLPSKAGKPRISKHRKQYLPCEIEFRESVEYVVEPREMNFTNFLLEYIDQEGIPSPSNIYEPRFAGHQTLSEREQSYFVKNQTLHCGFVKGPPGFSNSGFDLDVKDKVYMNNCKIVVSSCIFGSSDFLRRPARKKISEYSKENVCFVMFVDEQTLVKLSKEGNVPDDTGRIGLWKIVIVKNLPYEDMRRTGKVPKLLSHRLFPNSWYSIWIDSKMRLNADPMLIIEYFLWRKKSEYAISNHYDRHCVWEEVLQNKRLDKYNHTIIDYQFTFYQFDGLTKFEPLNPDNPLPSCECYWDFVICKDCLFLSSGIYDSLCRFYHPFTLADVPEDSFIVRAHTPMSNLFSCLWFNEVDRFTSRDQLSFAYTYLKLRKMNPDRPFYLNMFKDCERRAITKLFRHREGPSPPLVT